MGRCLTRLTKSPSRGLGRMPKGVCRCLNGLVNHPRVEEDPPGTGGGETSHEFGQSTLQSQGVNNCLPRLVHHPWGWGWDPPYVCRCITWLINIPGVSGCITRLVNHPQGWGKASSRGWVGGCLPRLVNNPQGWGDLQKHMQPKDCLV